MENDWFPPKDLDSGETILYQEDKSVYEKYNLINYYAISSLIGADIIPQSESQLLAAVLLIVLGPILIGILIGEFADVISVLTSTARHKNEQIDMINSAMFYLKLSEDMRNRINEYYDMISESHYYYEKEAFKGLNDHLRETIIMFKAQKEISKISFINDTSSEIIKVLLLNLEIEYFLAGDIILKQGEIGHKFYFIIDGLMEVVLEK